MSFIYVYLSTTVSSAIASLVTVKYRRTAIYEARPKQPRKLVLSVHTFSETDLSKIMRVNTPDVLECFITLVIE